MILEHTIMKDKRLFWIHLYEKGIKGTTLNSKLLIRYLSNFDRLVRKVAVFRGHTSELLPENAFDTYFHKIREGCAAIGIATKPSSYPSQFDLSKKDTNFLEEDPFDANIEDVVQTLQHINQDEENGFLIEYFPNPDHRVQIIDTVKKICPPKMQKVKITLNEIDEDFEQSKISIEFSYEHKKKLTAWIQEENPEQLSEIEGYFSGFRGTHDIFWIVDRNYNEIQCEYDKDLFSQKIDKFSELEHIKVQGTFINIPGKIPKIVDINNIISVDKMIEETIDDEYESNPDNFTDEFRKNLEDAQKEADSGKLMDESELLKFLSD